MLPINSLVKLLLNKDTYMFKKLRSQNGKQPKSIENYLGMSSKILFLPINHVKKHICAIKKGKNTMKLTKVLISGAGIAGLSLAIRLNQIGVDYVIVEKEDQIKTGASGIALPFNAVRLLRHMKCRDSILKEAHRHRVEKIIYSKSDGHILASSNLNDAPFSGEMFIALKRSKLLELLASKVQKPIKYSVKISTVTQKDVTQKKVACICLSQIKN